MCRLFRSGRVWSARLNDEDVRVAFAVLVVNLAYYAQAEQESKSLSHLVCDRLGLPYSQHTWEDEIGNPVARTLGDYFALEPRSGAFRYVSPINQQAGLNAASLKIFGTTLRELILRFGSSFSRREYDEALGQPDASKAPFIDFLST